MKNPKEYGKKKRTDKPSTLTIRQKHATARRDFLEKQSSTQIKTEMNFALAMNECTSWTVCNVPQKSSRVRYAKQYIHH